VADGSTAKTSPLTRRRTSARTLTRSFARTLVLIATLAFGLAFGAVTASGWTLSRSTLTEAQIRAGEINCVIMERAFAHGFTSAQIPETASACRIYSLSLRRP
jgi:hypothetical protein